MSKGKDTISPKRPILGHGKRKKEREIVEEKEETVSSQPCKRKRLTEVLQAPTPSPAKIDLCNPFHNRTQDRTKDRKNKKLRCSRPRHLERLRVSSKLHRLVSSTHTALEKDHALGDQPNCQS